MLRTALLVLALASGGGAPHLDRLLDLVSGLWAAGQGDVGGILDPKGTTAEGDVGNILDPNGAEAEGDAGNAYDPNG